MPTVQILQRNAHLGAFEKILVISFQRALLVSAHMLDSKVNVGYLLEQHSLVTPAEVKFLGGTALLPHWQDATKDLVDEAHKVGLVVRPWRAHNLEAAKRVLEAGVDGMTYDDPGELIAHLKETGIRGSAIAPA